MAMIGDGYYGGNLNGGVSVAPFEGHVDLTYTFLIPLRDAKSLEAKAEVLNIFKQMYDNLSDYDKYILDKQYDISEDIFKNNKNSKGCGVN